MDKYSEYYYEIIEKYKLFHKNGIKNQPGESTFLGYSLSKWIVKIQEKIKINNCSTLIDFGCGKGFLYKNKIKIGNKNYNSISDFWGIDDLYLYDPGIEEYSIYPKKKYDAVICTDVIEHIPEDDVINFIDNLFKLANKFIFVVIATIPASKYCRISFGSLLLILAKGEIFLISQARQKFSTSFTVMGPCSPSIIK